MTEELVTITVDGQELKAPKGAMLINVTDKENIRVPRFCYHEKLSVAAN
ncbi:MAG: (2Fe-2S)-binding protein, partial [Gammaproteobacteria bacterium]|nr:(2Fe-2S)-binding protein [Gammaproteobacteria bacterium]